MANRLYQNLWARLMANIVEPENEQACWLWNGARCRSWYGRLSFYAPGLGAHVKITAHVAAWVFSTVAPATPDDFWLAYLELRHSGLQLDHLCNHPLCLNIDHLEPVTPKENCRRRGWVSKKEKLNA